jgi:translation initiation factor IF-2
MVERMKVYELARELGMTSKELLALLKDLGIQAKSHMNILVKEEIEKIISKIEEKDSPTTAPAESVPQEPEEIAQVEVQKGEEVPVEKPEIKKPKEVIKIRETITVAELAQKLGIKVNELIVKLMHIGVIATINQSLDMATANKVAFEYGFIIELLPAAKKKITPKETVKGKKLLPRPPVITIMGHVDHGKTLLLDAIRESNVVAQEAGGITQHIGAYEVALKNGQVTFLDTPGHEAFTAMRARGAQVTDIVVLVVAADDGIMPQTIEAIDHARAAKVPIIVAINKCDLANADLEKAKRQLRDYNLAPEEWGGKTIVVKVSAKEKKGIDELLEMLLLEAEMLELKADPSLPAQGAVIEARLDKGKGPVATLLIQNGTLRVGDVFVVGNYSGRVKTLVNDRGREIKAAGPSVPVELSGLAGIPQAGDTFEVIGDETSAREIAKERQDKVQALKLAKPAHISLDSLYRQIEEGRLKELSLIIKGDVHGTIEALSESLENLSSAEVRINVIHRAPGTINESDVILASASDAVIIGFHVSSDPAAQRLALEENVDIRTYDIIYEAIENVKKAMKGMLAPKLKEIVLGSAEVRQIIKIPKGIIAGSYVKEGNMVRNARVRLTREGEVIHEGSINSLRRFKKDVKEVKEGFECGIGLGDFADIKKADIIEAYKMEEEKE